MLVFLFFFISDLGSLIYKLRGIDPDGDVLKFGVRAQSGSEVIRVEGISASEANVYLNQELDREVFYIIKNFFCGFV